MPESWTKRARKIIERKFSVNRMLNNRNLQICPCCFAKHAEEYAVDFNGVWLRASNLRNVCGVASPHYNLIRLNRKCLQPYPEGHIETIDKTISHELEHALIYNLLRSFGLDEKQSDIGCLCISEPSSGDLKQLRQKLKVKKVLLWA